MTPPHSRKRRFLAFLTAVALIFALGACSDGDDASKADIKEPKQEGKSVPGDYSVRVPDRLTVHQNVDLHPNLVELCIDGLGFVTTSRLYGDSFERVEKWDADVAPPGVGCNGAEATGPDLPDAPLDPSEGLGGSEDNGGEEDGGEG